MAFSCLRRTWRPSAQPAQNFTLLAESACSFRPKPQRTLRQHAFSSYHVDLRPFGIPFGMRPFSGLKLSRLICQLAFAGQRATISLNEIHPVRSVDQDSRPTSPLLTLGSNLSMPFALFRVLWLETFSGDPQFEQVILLFVPRALLHKQRPGMRAIKFLVGEVKHILSTSVVHNCSLFKRLVFHNGRSRVGFC